MRIRSSFQAECFRSAIQLDCDTCRRQFPESPFPYCHQNPATSANCDRQQPVQRMSARGLESGIQSTEKLRTLLQRYGEHRAIPECAWCFSRWTVPATLFNYDMRSSENFDPKRAYSYYIYIYIHLYAPNFRLRSHFYFLFLRLTPCEFALCKLSIKRCKLKFIRII